MDAEYMPRKRRSKKHLRRGNSKRRKRARAAKRNAKGQFKRTKNAPHRRRQRAKRHKAKVRRARVVNRVSSKGRGFTVKTKNGRIVAYRRFNIRTRRFYWKHIKPSTPQSRLIAIAKLHAFAGRNR